MIGERRTRALRDLTTHTLEARSMDEGLRLVAATIADYELDVPFILFYRIEADGQRATLVALQILGGNGYTNDYLSPAHDPP